jgi:hypothetical protein
MAEESSIVGLPRFNNQAMALTPAAGAGSDAGVTTEMSATDTMVSIFKDMRDSLDQLVTFASKQIKPIISIPSNLTTINTSIKSSEVGGTAEEKKDKEPGKITSMLSSLKQIIGEKFIGKKGMGAADATDGSLSKGFMTAPDALAKFMAGFGANPGMVKSKAGDSYATDSTQGKVIVQAEKDRAAKAKITARKENLADSEGKKDTAPDITGGKDEGKGKKGMLDSLKGMSKGSILAKAGIVAMLVALKVLFEFGDEISTALEPILKSAKEFYDVAMPHVKTAFFKLVEVFAGIGSFIVDSVVSVFGEEGAVYLGLAALAAIVFPNALMFLLGTGIGTIKFALNLVKGAFALMQLFLSGTMITKIGETYIGQGILRALAAMKVAFGLMKVFLLTTMPNALLAAYGGATGYVMTALGSLQKAFFAMKLFMMTTLPNALLAAYGGAAGYVMKAVTALKVAFTAMRVFLVATMIPAITTMMAPFVVPLALLVAAVLVAVAVFTSIKAGIDEFKQSLSEGDSMLESIIDGVATALLTLVTLPITLIKNFVAWVAEKLGFEGIAEKLREFSFVDSIKNGITTLVTKIKDFVVGLMGFDKIKSFFAKIGSIGGMMFDFVKAITAGAAAAIWPGLKPFGNGPLFEYNKAFDASMAGSEAKRVEKANAKFKLAELAEVEAENQKKKNEQKVNFYTTTSINKGGDTISTNAVTLANLSANHTEPTQMQLNMANR